MNLVKSDNLISFKEAKNKLNGCPHNRTIVDESLSLVTCQDCGKELNPIWVLKSMIRGESRLECLTEQYKRWLEKYEKRKKTKCIHCEKFTPVNVKL